MGEDLIRCELFAASVSCNAGDYLAGSYIWGSDAHTLPIILNGTRFLIRKNLLDFLRVFRNEHASTIIWIDAICIDQSNFSERTQQVALMSGIYGKASAVAIWLGSSSEKLEIAMDMICQFGTDDSIHLDPKYEHSVLVADGDERSQTLKVTPFFNLPWWFRIW